MSSKKFDLSVGALSGKREVQVSLFSLPVKPVVGGSGQGGRQHTGLAL